MVIVKRNPKGAVMVQYIDGTTNSTKLCRVSYTHTVVSFVNAISSCWKDYLIQFWSIKFFEAYFQNSFLRSF